jgi:hypothetical protein
MKTQGRAVAEGVVAQLVCSVPGDGFALLNADLKPARTPADAVYLRERRGGSPRKGPLPLRHADLAARFAAITDGDALAVLAFANDYGLLGLPGDGPEGPAAVGAERLSDWYESIRQVRSAIGLIQDARDPDARARLRGYFDAEYKVGPHSGIRFVGPLGADDFIESSDSEWRATYQAFEKRPRDLAWIFAQRSLDRGLRAHSAAKVVLTREKGRMTGAVVRFAPTSLLGAIWVHVGWLAEGAVEYRRCAKPGCLNVFVVEGGAGRGDAGGRGARTTCSGACRTALSRSRASRRAKGRSSRPKGRSKA